jgi:hypothetical protein
LVGRESKALLLARVLLIIFHFCGYFGVLDFSSEMRDKAGLQEITDHLMVARLSWGGSPSHMITYSPDKPGRAQSICAGVVFGGSDCRGVGWPRFQPSDMGRIGVSQGRRVRISPGAQKPVECTLRSWFSPSAAGRQRNRGRAVIYTFTGNVSRLFCGILQIFLDWVGRDCGTRRYIFQNIYLCTLCTNKNEGWGIAGSWPEGIAN